MLKPTLVTATIVQAIQSIAPLLVQMDNKPENIYAHNFDYGNEVSLSQAILEMVSPSILVAYKRILGGDFNQGQMWKHQLEIWISPMNMTRPDNPTPMSTTDVAWLIMNGPVSADTVSPPRNLRQISFLAGRLILMDVPTLARKISSEQNDWFGWDVSFPEWGDAPYAP